MPVDDQGSMAGPGGGSPDSGLDMRLLFEASPEVLLVLLPDAPDFTMVAATDARLAATHTKREQTIGRPLFEVFPDNPDDPEATGTSNLRASLERVLATGAPDTMAVQRYDIRGPDGTFQTKYWSPKNIPVRSNGGEVLYILHRVEDVTELVQATELGEELRGKTREMEREVVKRSQELADANGELREANAKLGQLDAAKTAFFSNVSHEFRTPLTLMLGPIEDALHREAGTLGGDVLRSVHRSAARLLRLVNALLDFSRLEAGRLEGSFEATDLAELTAGVAGSFQSLVESAGLSLLIDCPTIREPVHVDRSQWEKIVSNLVSNAFKFTMEGRIVVGLQERGDHVELIVSDTGVGIPENEIPRIFDRFHRVEGARGRSFEGTGIGLALVKELVGLHGGSIGVESGVGRGTTFTISVPLGSAHLPADRIRDAGDAQDSAGAEPFVLEAAQWLPGDQRDAPPERPPTEASPAERSRILVVDDNADMRTYVAGLLSQHWTVAAAADGEAALALIEADPPDLVLSDVMMPGMDGFELLRRLRSAPGTRDIPVILLSARAGEEAVVEGLEIGADAYLVKPFSARELMARVRAQLDATSARASALRVSETRFRRLAESGIVGISVADADGRIVEANEAFLDMVGYTREEMLAGEVAWGRLTPSGPAQAAGAREGECRRKDGHRIPMLTAVAPLENGESISVTLDLSDRRRLEDQLRQAQKMEAVGRLAGGIAHDFNNVLSVVLTCADFIGAELGIDEPLHAEVEEIRGAAERAADLTRQLLAFSRRQVLEPRVLSLNRVMSNVENILRRLLGADVTLALLLEPGLGNVEADPSQIEQIVMNLAVNARDAMPEGGRLTIQTGNVELDEDYAAAHHEVAPGAYVMLAVSDTGVGMDATTQARIFEPFFTTKEMGKGTGLGLSTVFGIVKQSRGHLWVYSEPGEGTTFKLYFPRVSGAEAALPIRRTPTSLRGDETILVVEDDAQVRSIATNILRRSGYTVLEAANGGEALLICEQHGARIDLVVTDVVLPLMGGREIVERVRSIRPEIKVLFMSGYTDNAILQHGILDSDVAYLQKPITPGLLTRKVREVIDGDRG